MGAIGCQIVFKGQVVQRHSKVARNRCSLKPSNWPEALLVILRSCRRNAESRSLLRKHSPARMIVELKHAIVESASDGYTGDGQREDEEFASFSRHHIVLTLGARGFSRYSTFQTVVYGPLCDLTTHVRSRGPCARSQP